MFWSRRAAGSLSFAAVVLPPHTHSRTHTHTHAYLRMCVSIYAHVLMIHLLVCVSAILRVLARGVLIGLTYVTMSKVGIGFPIVYA